MVSNIGVILETRIGLKTIERKKITAHAVKPIGLVEWNFKAYYPHSAPQLSHGVWVGCGSRVVERATKKLKYKCLGG